jgi:hypothetical protein
MYYIEFNGNFTGPITFGSRYTHDESGGGTYDNLFIFNRNLTQAEVQTYYARTANAYDGAAAIVTLPSQIQFNSGEFLSIALRETTTYPSEGDENVMIQMIDDTTFLTGAQGPTGPSVWTVSGNDVYYTSGNVGIGVTSPAYQLQLSTDDAAKLTTTTWATTSDMRLKEDIVEADYQMCEDVVEQLPLKYFKWNESIPEFKEEAVGDRHKLGWIAQEVELVIPKAVKNVGTMYGLEDVKFLNADQIYAVMYGAIKKLVQDKKKLEEEMNGLKERMVQLEKK